MKKRYRKIIFKMLWYKYKKLMVVLSGVLFADSVWPSEKHVRNR